MCSRPFFSIILSFYNSERYIEECINSVVQQSFDSWELILIDDGSVDNSSKIAQKYSNKDERVIYIKKDNSGAIDSREQGIRCAKGYYLIGLDSDDYFVDDALSTIYSTCCKGEVDMVVWGYEAFDGDSFKWYPSFDRIDKNEDVYLDIIMNTNHCFWNKAIKKKCLVDENILYPKTLKINLDYVHIITKVRNVNSVVSIKKPLYMYRIREDSISNSVGSKIIVDIGTSTEYVFDFLKNSCKITQKIYDALKMSYIKMLMGRIKIFEHYNKKDLELLYNQNVFRDSLQTIDYHQVGLFWFVKFKIFYLKVLLGKI